MTSRPLLALLVWCAAALPVRADPVTDDWTVFKTASYARLHYDEDKADWETRLYRAMAGAPDRDGMLAAFGRDIGVDPERAGLFADAIARSVRMREGCAATSPCDFQPGGETYRLIERAGLADPSGELLIAVGKNVGGGWGQPDGQRSLIRILQSHPRRLTVLAALQAYNEKPAYVAAMVLAAPRAPETLERLKWGLASVGADDDLGEGWIDAVLENGLDVLRREQASSGDEAVYIQAILFRRLATGRTDEALRMWSALAPEMRDRLPLAAAPCVTEAGAGRQACMARRTPTSWPTNWYPRSGPPAAGTKPGRCCAVQTTACRQGRGERVRNGTRRLWTR